MVQEDTRGVVKVTFPFKRLKRDDAERGAGHGGRGGQTLRGHAVVTLLPHGLERRPDEAALANIRAADDVHVAALSLGEHRHHRFIDPVALPTRHALDAREGEPALDLDLLPRPLFQELQVRAFG